MVMTSRSLVAVNVPLLRWPLLPRASYVNSGIVPLRRQSLAEHRRGRGVTSALAASSARTLANIARGHPGDFVDGRDSLLHFPPTVLAEGDHAFFERLIADSGGVGALHAQLADRVACDHE